MKKKPAKIIGTSAPPVMIGPINTDAKITWPMSLEIWERVSRFIIFLSYQPKSFPQHLWITNRKDGPWGNFEGNWLRNWGLDLNFLELWINRGKDGPRRGGPWGLLLFILHCEKNQTNSINKKYRERYNIKDGVISYGHVYFRLVSSPIIAAIITNARRTPAAI